MIKITYLVEKQYVIGKGDVVRGLCSYLEQNNIGEAEWGEFYRAARGSGEFWSNVTLSESFPLFLKERKIALSRVRLLRSHEQPWQASLSLGFSRQEHWSGLPFPSPKGGGKK